MRYFEIMENTIDINSIISVCKKKFGDSLYGGNCGMFSMALGQYLKDNGINSRYVVYSDFYDEDESDNITVSDLISYECQVYHIALYANGNLYDGDGSVNDNHILGWIEQEYGDDEVTINNFPFSDPKMSTLINNDTDWSISNKEFYNFIKGIKL